MQNDPSQPEALRSEGDINFSARRTEWAARHINPATQSILDEDSAVFLHQSLSTPCLNAIVRAQGCYLIDQQGRQILDFHGNSVHQLGHGHPRVIAAIQRQMETLPFVPRRYTHETAIALAKRITQLAPGDLDRVLFAPSGAIAMGMALKLARAVTGRFKTVSMWDAFHGASLDTISIGGEAVFRKDAGPLLPGTEHVPPPDPRHCPFKCGTTCSLLCADYVEYVLEKEGDVAAVIAETVRSTPYIPPLDYWTRIRAACDRHGALLILDEIPTCLGRTGKMFACEHYGIVPDMLVIGKGLGGGMIPMAALIARGSFNVVADKALGHYTHEKSALGCAAALETIETIIDEQVLEHAARIGEYTMAKLRELQRKYDLVADVRGLGMLFGIELVRADGSRAVDEAERVLYASLEAGLSFKIGMGNVLSLYPPLIIDVREMQRALDILDDSIGLVSTRRGSS